MSSFKVHIVALAAICLFASCSARRYVFDPVTYANSVKSQVAALAGTKSKTPITTITIYKAELTEKLVERDRVSEYRLMNRYSKKPTVPVLISRYRHDILLFCFEDSLHEKYVVLTTATYDADNNCIGIGGSYAGRFRARFRDSGFAINHALTIKTTKGKLRTIKSIRQGEEFEMDVFMDNLISPYVSTPIRIHKIVQRSKNKIAGLNKDLVYTIDAIFNDADAMTFTRMDTDD